MAATIITVVKTGDSDTNIKIKVNDGYTIPVTTCEIQSFRTWVRNNDHIFVWVNSAGREMSMVVPQASIGWVTSTLTLADYKKDRFARYNQFVIDAPCRVTVEVES